jgi:predicted RNA-binding protein with PUA domain
MGKKSGNKKGKDKVILLPELPEIDDDDIVVSDEDVEFYSSDKRRADLVRKFDQKSIDRYASRLLVPRAVKLCTPCAVVLGSHRCELSGEFGFVPVATSGGLQERTRARSSASMRSASARGRPLRP